MSMSGKNSRSSEGKPSDSRREPPDLLWEIAWSIVAYVRGQVLIALVMTLLYAAGFFWIGVPLWWLAAPLCGLFHLIPIVGAVLAVMFPIFFSLLGGGGLRELLLIVLLFAGVQLLESFYLTPKILGRELSLRPLVVFVSVLAGGLLFGPLGALMAAPAVAIALLIWKRVDQARNHDAAPSFKARTRDDRE